MKKIFYTTVFSLALAISANAQCTPVPPSALGVFSPDVMPLVHQGSAYNEFTSFGIPTSINVAGTHSIDSVEFIRVDSLPAGITATFNNANKRYKASEIGCVQFTGTTTDTKKSYYLDFRMIAWIDHLPAATPEVSATQANLDLTLVVTNPTAINDLKNTLSDLAIYPNPMTKSAELSFNSETSGKLNVSIVNVLGSVVSKSTIDSKIGNNTVTIERNNLQSGVYFVVVNNGKTSVTRKVVIAE